MRPQLLDVPGRKRAGHHRQPTAGVADRAGRGTHQEARGLAADRCGDWLRRRQAHRPVCCRGAQHRARATAGCALLEAVVLGAGQKRGAHRPREAIAIGANRSAGTRRKVRVLDATQPGGASRGAGASVHDGAAAAIRRAGGGACRPQEKQRAIGEDIPRASVSHAFGTLPRQGDCPLRDSLGEASMDFARASGGGGHAHRHRRQRLQSPPTAHHQRRAGCKHAERDELAGGEVVPGLQGHFGCKV